MSAPDELTTVVDSCPQCGGARFYSYQPVAWSGQVCACVRAPTAPQGAEPVKERGPWTAHRATRMDDAAASYVASDDFSHDVRLYVSGDFADGEQRMRYTEEIARRLNAAPSADAGVREALERLVAKLDEIEASPQFKGIWPILEVHGCGYRGPNYADELASAKRALTTTAAPQGAEPVACPDHHYRAGGYCPHCQSHLHPAVCDLSQREYDDLVRDAMKWRARAIADAASQGAEIAKELLVEAMDLVPRMSDDDPIAPALAEWLRKVRAALTPTDAETKE